MKWFTSCSLIVILLLAMGSCASTGSSKSPYLAEENSGAARRTSEAEQLSREGANLIDAGELQPAEDRLREALAADLFYGPAHNNLGVLFLKQGKLYEAASEFEWAKKLMPDSASPRVNLALTLEQAGSFSEAMNEYDSALAHQPGCLAAMKGAASLALRTGGQDDRIQGWLNAIASRDSSPAWKEWALYHSLDG